MWSLAKLIPHPKNPYKITEADRKSMAASIKEHGIEVAVEATPIKDDPDNLRIISGHRRVGGAQEAGLSEIPVVMREFQNEDDEVQALLLANEYRRKSELEIAKEIFIWDGIWERKRGTRTDLQDIPENERLSTRQKVAQRFRKSEATVDKYLFILEHRPSLFDMVDNNQISIEGAYNVSKLIYEKGLPENLEDDILMTHVIEISTPELLEQIERGDIERKDAFTASVRKLSRLKKTKPAKETEPSSEPLQVEEPKKEVAAEASTNGEIELPAVGDEEQAIEGTGTETGENSREAQATEENEQLNEGLSEGADESEESDKSGETNEEAGVEETKVVTMPDAETQEEHFCQVEGCPCFGKVVRVIDNGRTAA